MTNKEMSKEFGIPQSTLSDWSQASKDNWRYKVYIHLRYNGAKLKPKGLPCLKA